MLAILLGLGSAAAFAANSIITRRGMLRVSPNYVATISIFTGLFFFLPVTGATGDLFRIGGLQAKAYLFWGLAGVIHFVLGRTWGYRCLHLLGSTRSNIITNASPVFTIVLAVVILGERVTPMMFLGIVLSLAGPLLIIFKEKTVKTANPLAASRGKELDRATLHRGVFYGIGAALFWGSSFIFIKFGLQTGGSAVAGNLLSYAAASAVIGPSVMLNRENRKEILTQDRQSLQVAMLSGLTTSIAQLLRFLSLAYGSVIVVSVLGRTSPLWILLLAFLFNRRIESFSRWVFIGNALLMVGAFLVSL
jgi:drug/metabolite transporter (DMT)-like permease